MHDGREEGAFSEWNKFRDNLTVHAVVAAVARVHLAIFLVRSSVFWSDGVGFGLVRFHEYGRAFVEE